MSISGKSLFNILAAGPFQIKATWANRKIIFPRPLVREIRAHWTQKAPPSLFNGRMARLDRWCADGSVLSITLSVTDYQTLFYSNSHVEHIEKEWGAEYLSKALGISAVLVTGDKKIPVIKRSSHVGEYPGCLDVFGGHIDVERAGDVIAAMRDELLDEVGLSGGLSLMCLGLVENAAAKKPELVFLAKTRMTSEEIEKSAERAIDRAEYGDILTVTQNRGEINAFLKQHGGQFSPSGYASLYLYSDLFDSIDPNSSFFT